jgi:hypothetical protein
MGLNYRSVYPIHHLWFQSPSFPKRASACPEGLVGLIDGLIQLPPHISEPCLCMVLLKAQENACKVPHHIPYTSAAFHFHLPNNASLPLCNEMKLQHSNSLRTHRKLTALCISATSKRLVATIERAIFPYSCNERAWC